MQAVICVIHYLCSKTFTWEKDRESRSKTRYSRLWPNRESPREISIAKIWTVLPSVKTTKRFCVISWVWWFYCSLRSHYYHNKTKSLDVATESSRPITSTDFQIKAFTFLLLGSWKFAYSKTSEPEVVFSVLKNTQKRRWRDANALSCRARNSNSKEKRTTKR